MPGRAQAVRGTLVAGETNQPLVGTLGVLVDPAGVRHASALTDPAGRFLLRAPAAGTYRVLAERVGIQSSASPPLDLVVGSEIEHRLVARSEAVSLEGLVVTAGKGTRCTVRPQGGAATAQVWEEARKTLYAARHTQAQALRSDVTRYKRDLDPKSLRLRWERRSRTSGTSADPFVSLPAPELARGGYVQEKGEEFVYYAPDAAVLLSEEFLDGHCFRLMAGTREEAGLLGLAFEPVRGRSLPGVAGTLWLDAARAEVRFLEFRYTGLERLGLEIPGGQTFGGRIEFRPLENGGWIADQWWIRMPVLAERVTFWDGRARKASHLAAMTEEGGRVLGVRAADGTLLRAAQLAGVAGVVFDSTRAAPLAGARVFLEGTEYAATTDAAGRFRLQAPEGHYMIGFTHPRLDSLGFSAIPGPLVLIGTGTETLHLALPSPLGIRASACPDGVRHPGTAVLTGVVTNRASDAPLADARVAVTWTGDGAGRAETVSDAAGRYLICAVPANRPVTAVASFLGAEGAPARLVLGDSRPVEQPLDLRWYSTVAETPSGLSLGASRQPVRVTGRIVDAATGLPVAGAVVRLPRAGLERTTDRSGGFALAAVPPGLYTVEVRSPGHAPLSREIAVGGGAMEIELRVQRP